MKIQISNQAGIPNKYIRFAKWKLLRTKDKFEALLYAEIYLSREGVNPVLFQSAIKLGVAGKDIVLRNKSDSIEHLWKLSFNDIDRYMRKYKERNTGRGRIAQAS